MDRSDHDSKRERSRHRWMWYTVSMSLLLVSWLIGANDSRASIRLDGSEFQSSSAIGTTSQAARIVSADGRKAVFANKIVMTLAQPVMARGSLPSTGGNSDVFKIGLGYEYNVWGTAFNRCSCPCFSDPMCDGSFPDVKDVIKTIDVAIRGAQSSGDPGCAFESADLNCDYVINISDVVIMIDVAFRGADVSTSICTPCQ